MPKPRSDLESLRAKSIECRFKALDDEDDAEGSFELYCAVFGNVDRHGDVIDPGAVANLDEFVAEGMGLVNHDLHSLPIAYVVSAVQDAKGVKVVGRFHSDPQAQRVRTVVRERLDAGKSVKCSIGFRVVDGASETIGGRTIYRIKSLLLYEFSFVNIPANPRAGVTDVKSEDAMVDRKGAWAAFKAWLGLSTKKGRAMSRANYEALKAHADEMGTHVEEAEGLLKSLGGYHAKCKGLHEALSGHLSKFDPDRDEEEPEDDGPDDDGPDDAPPAGKKSADVDEDERRQILKLKAAQYRRALDAA